MVPPLGPVQQESQQQQEQLPPSFLADSIFNIDLILNHPHGDPMWTAEKPLELTS